jgi:hypothetical protein
MRSFSFGDVVGQNSALANLDFTEAHYVIVMAMLTYLVFISTEG